VDAGGAVSLVGSFFVLALVLLGVAAMVGGGSLDRNGAVGIRTRATRASDDAWKAGHEAAHGALRATGLLCLGFGVLTALLALVVRGAAAEAVVVGTAAAGYAALVAGLVVTSRRANTAARRAAPTDGS